MGPSLSSETQTAEGPGGIADGDQQSEADPLAVTENPSDGGQGESVSERTWGLTLGDRHVVSVFVLMTFVLIVINWVRIVGWKPSSLVVSRPEGEAYRFVVDVNRATWVEWMQLDGIGETMARRIVAYRL